MARIAGVDLPREKRVEIALRYIYGIGPTTSREILEATGVSPDTRVRDLTEAEISRLRDYIDRNYRVEGDLRREVSMNIKRLMEIGSYRGVRHRRNLPVRGQRTRTNARTRKGPQAIAGQEVNRLDSECGRIHGTTDQREGQANPSPRAKGRIAGPGAHSIYVQQHDHHHHRSAGQHAHLEERGVIRVQRLSQEHAVCGAGCRPIVRQAGHGFGRAGDRRVHQGAGPRPRGSPAGAVSGGLAGAVHHRRHADPTQRLSAP